MTKDSDKLRLVNELAHMIRTEADKRARIFGMTYAQWFILKRVARAPGLSQREIAEHLEVEPITVARLVDRLEAAGLIERRAEPNDRRIWRLHCTDAALPVLSRLDQESGSIYAAATNGIDPKDVELLFETIRRMKDNFGANRRCPAPDEFRETA